MKNKTFSLFALSVFVLVLLASGVSAISLAPITTFTIPTSVNQTVGSFNIIFNLDNTGSLNNGTLDFTASTVSTGSLSFPTNLSIGTEVKTITAKVSFPTNFIGNIS